MTLFLVAGVLGALLLLVTLLLDDILDGIFDFADSGFISGPAIGAFLAAFGFGGALSMSAGIAPSASVGVGIVAGFALGAVAGLVTRMLVKMPTTATPTEASLVGSLGTVVTSVPSDGFGEVSVMLVGQSVKFSARSAETLPAGTHVVVERVLSPTSVWVVRHADS